MFVLSPGEVNINYHHEVQSNTANIVCSVMFNTRSLLVISAIVGVSLASEAAFLSFAKTFNKKYDTAEEFHKRMQIFEVG